MFNQKAYNKAYHRIYQKKYNQEHKEEIKIYREKYAQEHKKEMKMYNKKYAQEHKEEINARIRKRYQKGTVRRRVKSKDSRIKYSNRSSSKYSTYKSNAKQRNLSFNLTFGQFMTFWQKPCAYCNNSIETIGLDRIDNERGYELDNVMPCCRQCNVSRSDYSQIEFIKHCKKVVDNCSELL